MSIAARTAYRLRSRGRRLPAGSQDPQIHHVAHPQTWAQGWILVERGYSRVRVEVSGTGVFSARLHSIGRPDITRLSAHPSAPMSGWEAVIDVPDMEPGTPVTLTATAEGAAGELRLGCSEVGVAPSQRQRVHDREWVAELARRTQVAALAPPDPPEDGRLRLLVFTHSLDLGGGQLYLQELLRLLMREGGVDCTVVAPADGPLRRELEEWGVDVHICAGLPFNGPRYEGRLAELAALARSRGADLVLANTVLCFDGIDLATRMGLPAIWAIHDSIPVERCEGGVFAGLDEHVVTRFRTAVDSHATLVFEAEATLDLYRRYADGGRLRRIDWGIPLGVIADYRRHADRERLRRLHGFQPDDHIIVCVGTIEPRKAQVSLALAFGQAAAARPDAALVFIGDTHSPYSDGLREVVSRFRAGGGRVRIEPLTPDVMQWLEMADGFALVSDTESLPRSIMEAMAFGLPVLGTRAWGIPELIDDGVNGLLCEPNDFASLADGMRRLLDMEAEERDAIGAAAVTTIHRNRDSSRYVREVSELLGELARPAHSEHGGAGEARIKAV